MQKYTKPKYEYSKLGKNPCAVPLVIPVNEIEYKNQYKLVDDVLLNVTAEVEATPFTRIYLKPSSRKLISKLTPSAKELLLWVMYEINSNEDALWINKERFMLESSTSLNTFKKAIHELVLNAFLAYTVVKEVYWINPEFFFRGSRLEKYPDKITKTK